MMTFNIVEVEALCGSWIRRPTGNEKLGFDKGRIRRGRTGVEVTGMPVVLKATCMAEVPKHVK